MTNILTNIVQVVVVIALLPVAIGFAALAGIVVWQQVIKSIKGD